MRILGIETSCDETALSLIEASEGPAGVAFQVLGDKTLSQIALHREYGGVFPNLAKREHNKNLIPLLKAGLEEAGLLKFKVQSSKFKTAEDLPTSQLKNLQTTLEREPELLEQFLEFIPSMEEPPVDAIAVTHGPGLEPCLWTGVNFAKALSVAWSASRKIPVVPVNHMEGHIFSALLRKAEISNSKFLTSKQTTNYKLQTIDFPAIALLISGGHTELVLVKNWFEYEIVGQTRDDAVGEAFDKVARLLGLPYPGGPEISRLAEQERELRVSAKGGSAPGGESSKLNIQENSKLKTSNLGTLHLPRPMIHSKDLDFSFSGIKTAVLYLIRKLTELTPAVTAKIALEFETAVTEVLVSKTRQALDQFGARALLVGGGVIANAHIRRSLMSLSAEAGIPLYLPEPSLTTDNALMIAVAGFLRHKKGGAAETLRVQGNLSIGGE